jgi:SUKH-3 immunity protein
MSQVSSAIVNVLREAGWQENRNVTHALALPSQFALFPRAQEVLAEFGGLRFGSCGAGIECGTSDVYIDPCMATHMISELQSYEKILQTKLFALGEVDGGHGYLIIDEEGRTYILSAMSLDLGPLAATFSQCLEFLLLGKRLSRQQIEATWPETTASGSRALYAITYNKWGWPAFRPKE